MAGDPHNYFLSSRRDLFRLAAAVAAFVGIRGSASAQGIPQSTAAAAPSREALETLTASEARTLDAFCARLIPTDALGPGAIEAHVSRYIDRALAGALATSREDYRSGLAALDAYARSLRGAPFADLPPETQDAVLADLEKNTASGFAQGSGAFFALVYDHTLQGMFSDPYYGGNADFAGWNLIGYPGIRLAVSEQDQAMSPHLTPVRQSAYDFPMFNRLSAAAASQAAPVDQDHMPDGMGNMQHDR